MNTLSILFTTRHIFHPLSKEDSSKKVDGWDRFFAGLFLVVTSIFTIGGSAIFYSVMAHRKFEKIKKETSPTASKAAKLGGKVLGKESKILRDLKDGTISFNDFEINNVSFSEKLRTILKNTTSEQYIKITDVPTKSGTGTMHLTIKEEKVFGEHDDITSQVHDEIYREELKKFKNSKHYVFEFVDIQRPSTSPELEAVLANLRSLQSLQNKFSEYMSDRDVQKFIKNLTPNEKLILRFKNTESHDSHHHIISLYNKVTEEGSFDLPINMARATIDSINTELTKPSITVRISEGGEIGELKIVNIQSDEMTGNHLMQVFDKSCVFMGVEQMYLEDVAQIEKEEVGSYNLRLFRYFTTDDKTSWYTDSYNFLPYTRDSSLQIVNTYIHEHDPIREKINHFKIRELSQVQSDLENAGFTELKKNEFLEAIQRNADETCQTVPDIINKLAPLALQGNPVHRDMNTLITTFLELYKDYTGSDEELSQLKIHAKDTLGANAFRKSYR